MTLRLLAIAALLANGSAAAQGLEGRWRLVAGEDLNADGSVARYPWGRAPVGSIVVQDGACYLQIMSSDVPSFPRGDVSTVEQMSQALFSTYISYTGPCTVDPAEGRVTLDVRAAWRPDYRVDQTRYFRVEGDVLFFGPTPRVRTDPPWDPATIPEGTFTRRLRLERVRDTEPSASLRPPPDAPPPHPAEPGPHAVSIIAEPTLATHTVYRPTELAAFSGADRLPIVAWGNGACSNAGLLFSRFLTQIASHGFLVIASGPKDAPLPAFATQLPGQASVTPDASAGIEAGRTTDVDLLRAIDWAVAENARPASPYFGRLDPEKVAVMGQSCGGLQATAVAGDPRIKTVVIWNSGVFPDDANRGAALSGASKASLSMFHTPVAYFLGGPTDIAYANGKDDFARLERVPAFLGSIRSGHGGTYMHPGGGWFGEVGVAWLQWQLNGDRDAARYFEGAECLLCREPAWEVDRKNMRTGVLGAWRVGLTSWGDPDLQGTWNYGTMTPLERPRQWADRESLTEEEARAYERQTVERRAGALQTAGPDWWEPQNNVLRNRRTSLIVDPADGRMPPRIEQVGGRQGGGGRGNGPRYDDPESLSLQDRCITWPASGPPMMPTVYNNNVLIVQSPGYVVLLTEMIHNARVVPMDGRPHDAMRSMYGDPRGHWEGETLVVESVNFDGRVPFRGSGENLQLTERFTRTGEDQIEYRFTVEDTTLWARPWTVRVDMGPADGPLLEFACHEGNERSVSGILSGARYEERVH